MNTSTVISLLERMPKKDHLVILDGDWSDVVSIVVTDSTLFLMTHKVGGKGHVQFKMGCTVGELLFFLQTHLHTYTVMPGMHNGKYVVAMSIHGICHITTTTNIPRGGFEYEIL